MESQSIDNKLSVEKLSQIEKVKNNKAIILVVVLMIIGIGAIIFGFLQIDMQSILFGIGAVCLMVAALLFLLKHKHNVYKATGSPIKKHDYYMNNSHLNQMTTLLDHASFSSAQPIPFMSNANVRVEVILSADKQFAATQLSSYVPFEYYPTTEVYCFNGIQAADFATFLEKCNKI